MVQPIDKRKLLGDNFDCDKIAEDLLAKLEDIKHSVIKSCSHTLDSYQKTIQAIRVSLPFLEKELMELEKQLVKLKVDTLDIIEEIEALKDKLLSELERSKDSDLQFERLTEQRVSLIESRQRYLNVTLQAENLLNNREGLYLVQMARSNSVELGGGLDEVITVNAPKAEEQMFSIEKEIAVVDEEIQVWSQQRISLHKTIEDINDDVLNKTVQIKNSIARLQKNVTTLGEAIAELELLHQIGAQDTIYGAAVRGDETRMGGFLYSQHSPNQTDHHNRKPIYYAFRCGHAVLATALMDYTELSKRDIEEILTSLPKQDKVNYSLLVSILENKNTFDHLWNEQETVGKNIQTIFQDYFSPNVFGSFSFLSNEGKRALSLNWNRKHTNTAEDIFNFFKVLEDNMSRDIALAKKFIDSKLKAYTRENPDDLLDPFARRLLYVQNKLEAAKVQQEFSMLAHGNIGFFGSADENNEQNEKYNCEMGPL